MIGAPRRRNSDHGLVTTVSGSHGRHGEESGSRSVDGKKKKKKASKTVLPDFSEPSKGGTRTSTSPKPDSHPSADETTVQPTATATEATTAIQPSTSVGKSNNDHNKNNSSSARGSSDHNKNSNTNNSSNSSHNKNNKDTELTSIHKTTVNSNPPDPHRNPPTAAHPPTSPPRRPTDNKHLLSRMWSGTGTEVEADGSSAQIWAFLVGTVFANAANNAMQVSSSLMILTYGDMAGWSISANHAMMTLASALTNVGDAVGTILGGFLLSYMQPKVVMILATSVRIAILLGTAVKFMIQSKESTTPATFPVWVLYTTAASFVCDSFFRGILDTSRNVVPLLFGGEKKEALARLNADYQGSFQLGGLVGPLITGFIMHYSGLAGASFTPVGLIFIANIFYFFIPKIKKSLGDDVPAGDRYPWRAAVTIARQPFLLVGTLAIFLGQTNRFKTYLPAIFAKSALHQESIAAWYVSAFGLGGVIGSVIYRVSQQHAWSRLSVPAWLLWSAVGVLVLAWGYYPSAMLYENGDSPLISMIPYLFATIIFGILNIAGRVASQVLLHEHMPKGAGGGVMGCVRFTAEMSGMILKLASAPALKATNNTILAFAYNGCVYSAYALGLVGCAWGAAILLKKEAKLKAENEAEAASLIQGDDDLDTNHPSAKASYGSTGRMKL